MNKTLKAILIAVGALIVLSIAIAPFLPEEDEVSDSQTAESSETPRIAPPSPEAVPPPPPTPEPSPEPTETILAPEPGVDPVEWANESQAIANQIIAANDETIAAAGREDFAGLVASCDRGLSSVDFEKGRRLARNPPAMVGDGVTPLLLEMYDRWERAFQACARGDLEEAVVLIEQATNATIEATTFIEEAVR